MPFFTYRRLRFDYNIANMKISKSLGLAMKKRIKQKISPPKGVDARTVHTIVHKTLRGIVTIARKRAGCETRSIKTAVASWRAYVTDRGYEGVLDFVDDAESLERWAEAGRHDGISRASNVDIGDVVRMEREQAPERTNESNMYKGRNTIANVEN